MLAPRPRHGLRHNMSTTPRQGACLMLVANVTVLGYSAKKTRKRFKQNVKKLYHRQKILFF